MSVEIRPAEQAEMFDFGAVAAYVYGGAYGDTPDNVAAQANRPEWTLCAFIDGVMGATLSTLPMRMNVLGATVPLGGITAVGTLPEYRRQGLLRQLMTRAFSDMRDRGQSLTALWASQADIYQRYQFGALSSLRHYTVDTTDISFHDGDMGDVPVTRIDTSGAMTTLTPVYEAFIAPRAGYLQRRTSTWRYNVLAEVTEEGPVHVAICQGASGATGYVVYTLRHGKVDHRTRSHALTIRELVALDGNSYRSLWRFIKSHDLVGKVTWQGAPSDDPALVLFAEPRLLHTELHEGLWVRLVDIAMALQARPWPLTAELRFNLAPDPLTPWNDGAWLLQTGDGQAEVSPTRAAADLSLNTRALSLLYMGVASASQLAAAGLVTGDAATLAAMDQLFATPHAPHCPDNF